MYLLQSCICEVSVGSFVDIPLLLDLVVIRQAIHFVNEHFKADIWVYFVSPGHCEMQSTQSFHIVILSWKEKFLLV